MPLRIFFLPYYCVYSAAGIYHMLYGGYSALFKLGYVEDMSFVTRGKVFPVLVVLLISCVWYGVFSFMPTPELMEELADDLAKFKDLAIELLPHGN